MNKRKYRLGFHLMPPSGWMNDPNGLCYYKGMYHVFFQYAPKDPNGTERYWGHYISKDLLTWEYVGVAIKSDHDWDRSGAFSGCGFTEDGSMELFYTGNVMEEGDFDYIHAGRGANVITVKSEDGMTFSKKELLLSNQDYPDDYTCHVRDPKVWKKDDTYYMLLGGRKRGDKGAILQYESKDKVHWTLSGEMTTKEAFGYMWECPDVVTLDGKTVLMCCPQGVPRNELRFQNICQCGYFILEDREKEQINGFCDPDTFVPWDYGYDFYAPQTFQDAKGRTLLIGWGGMPDMDAWYTNKPIIEEGWQHSLTVPRVLTMENGVVHQNPIEELKSLRQEQIRFVLQKGAAQYKLAYEMWDMEIQFQKGKACKSVIINDDVSLVWENGIFTMLFAGDCGCGREKRQIMVEELEDIRILKDVSMLEIYLNHGEYVLTTRYFPSVIKWTPVKIQGAQEANVWDMKKMNVSYHVDENE